MPGKPQWVFHVQKGFAGGYTEVKAVPAVIPQKIWGAGHTGVSEGPARSSRKGVQGQHREALSSECKALCRFDFLFHLLLPPQRFSSLLQGSCRSWIAAGTFYSLLMRNSCTLSLETEPRSPRGAGEGLRLRLQGEEKG